MLPAEIFLTLTFLFATRNSLVWLFAGISFDQQIITHKFFSYMSVIFGWTHGIDQIYWQIDKLHIPSPPLRTLFSKDEMWSGLVMVSAMSLLVATGILFKFFSSFFETFYWIHWVLFLTVLIFCVLHENLLPFFLGGGLFAIDMILRMVFQARYKETKQVLLQPIANTKILRVSWEKKKFKYWPG